MSSTRVFVLLVVSAVQGLQPPKLVYPRILEERSPDGKMVLHLHDELTLNLEAASVAAHRMRVITEENGRPATEFYDGEEINRNLYQDAAKMATVSLKASGKSVQLEGIVGPKHRIHPLPATERSESGLVPHMIHEIQHKEMIDKVLPLTEESQPTRISARSNWNAPQNVPPEVTVEVFIVLDKPHHTHFNSTKDLLIYLSVTLNSAKLRFSDMVRPKVKLMLTGTEKNLGETFIRGNTMYAHDSETLSEFKNYAVRKRGAFGTPDVVFLFTGRDVVTDDANGKLSTGGLGIAYLGGMCTNGYVGLGEDHPGFYDGMFTFSHEMGHLLGAQHDGSSTVPLVPGYVGSEACPWDDGFMMSYKDHGANHQRFSRCSLEQMRIVIMHRGRTCWNILSAGQEHSDLFPGNMVTPEEVCKIVFPNQAKVNAEVIFPKKGECKLKCSYKEIKGMFIHTYSQTTTAPDYSSCGKNQVCVRGLCIYDKDRKGNYRNQTESSKPRKINSTTKVTTRTTTKRRWYRWKLKY
uniref:Putative tick metalloprotease 1 n=1 Tax=Amblyomma triste TaxID=251400 RepID=A0A023GAK9_AMBTT